MNPLSDFKKANFYHRLNRMVQIVLALTLILGINYTATRYYTRGDLSQDRTYSLSAETLAYLRHLNDDVKVIVTISGDSPRSEEQLLYRYTRDMLKEYHHNSRDNSGYHLTVEYVDIYQNLKRAEELSRTYGLDQPNLVLFASSKRQRIVTPSEILEFENRKPTAFRGEQAFTSALLEVTTESQPVIYFTVGHGEMRADSVDPIRGLTEIVRELQSRNILLKKLDLMQWSAVPEDADLVIVADPQGSFSPEEQEILRNYLSEKAGRLILFTSPGRDPGLKDLLQDWGLRSDDFLVLEQDGHYQENSGNFLIRQFADHPITESLLRNQTPLIIGACRPVMESKTAIADDRLARTPLMASSKISWAESTWQNATEYSFDPQADIVGPITVGMLAERSAASQLGINLPGGRLLVIGSGDLVANRRVSSYGNYTFTLNAINWMLNRNSLLAIPPRRIERIQFSLSGNDILHSGLGLLIVPAILAMFGVIVHLIRRN